MHAGFHTGVLAGEGREVLGSKFLLARPLLAHYVANAILHMYFTSWKIAPGVHGVLDKIK